MLKKFIITTSITAAIAFLFLNYDNRICYNQMRYVSDIDYLMYGLDDIRESEIENFEPIVEITNLLGVEGDFYKKNLQALVFDDADKKSLVILVSNTFDFNFQGKELALLSKNRGFFLALFSPCGEKLSSTE